MIINVSQIREDQGLKVEHRYPEGQPELGSVDRSISGRPELKFRASREGVKVRLAGRLSAQVDVLCARCLSPIRMDVDEPFDLLYLPPLTSARENEEKELATEELVVAFYQGDVIDLDDLVREQIELSLPMTGLCRDECKGLCPSCGANLNKGECACERESIDPRWAALRDINQSN
ncbi:MAG TPA: DUF177 domain-containing protein [Blastocatellia bacterium]|nr:DUF177 domain-containing protein [Blastocatellia bacterium]